MVPTSISLDGWPVHHQGPWRTLRHPVRLRRVERPAALLDGEHEILIFFFFLLYFRLGNAVLVSYAEGVFTGCVYGFFHLQQTLGLQKLEKARALK